MANLYVFSKNTFRNAAMWSVIIRTDVATHEGKKKFFIVLADTLSFNENFHLYMDRKSVTYMNVSSDALMHLIKKIKTLSV